MGLLWKCAVVVAATTVQSLGLTLQRLSHVKPPLQAPYASAGGATPVSSAARADAHANSWSDLEQSQDGGSLHSNAQGILENPVVLWRVGIAMFIFANLFGSTVQLAVLPLVLVSTLQATGLVANSVLACLILKEPLTMYTITGTFLVVLGALLVAAVGGVQTDPYPSLDELFELYWTPRFTLWMVLTLLTAVALGMYARRLAAPNSLSRNLFAHNQNSTRIGWLWGITGGVASAHSLLMAKLSIGLLVRDLPDTFADLLRPKFYIIVLCFLVFALSQMWCVNCGLRYISTSVLYPLVFCVYNATTLANSVVLYEASALFEEGSLVWVVLGTAVLIFGVLLLSTRFEDDTDRADVGRISEPEPSRYPRWLVSRQSSRQSSPRISLGTLVTAPVGSQGTSLNSMPTRTVPSPSTPTAGAVNRDSSPLLDGNPSYTSFDSISPNITNPDKMRGRSSRRVLSREQHQILRELGI